MDGQTQLLPPVVQLPWFDAPVYPPFIVMLTTFSNSRTFLSIYLIKIKHFMFLGNLVGAQGCQKGIKAQIKNTWSINSFKKRPVHCNQELERLPESPVCVIELLIHEWYLYIKIHRVFYIESKGKMQVFIALINLQLMFHDCTEKSHQLMTFF